VPVLFQDGKHVVERPTILYMPHCDLGLYENIIGANWSEERLARIVFIANRFSDYTDKYVSTYHLKAEVYGRSPQPPPVETRSRITVSDATRWE
jgi:hypothetical protein